MPTNHSASGTYKAEEFLPSEALDLTLEQVLALLIYKISRHPENVNITFVNTPRIKVLEFDVHPNDRCMVLGRDGFMIRALRTLSKAILGPSVKEFRYNIDITPDAVSENQITTE